MPPSCRPPKPRLTVASPNQRPLSTRLVGRTSIVERAGGRCYRRQQGVERIVGASPQFAGERGLLLAGN